jgi:hypothetical protein
MPVSVVRIWGFVLGIFISLASCAQPDSRFYECEMPNHELWSRLLQKHVSTAGFVSYSGFRADSVELNIYLGSLSKCLPSATWSRQERLAYWINAYNAFTIKLIIDHYPVKSIKDIGSKLAVPFVNSVWDAKFFSIGGVQMSLNQIEHSILRKQFDEPRIHFAIVCASISCPSLMNSAYTASDLESQLQRQALSFIQDSTKNHLSLNRLELSSIFKWFKSDFTKHGSLKQFVAKYADEPFAPRAKVDFLEYNWELNGK